MNASSLRPGFEIVHVVTGYYDGILDGIADYGGRPHHFELASLREDDRSSDEYRLTLLTRAVFQAAMDAWEIWCRWERAHRAGEVEREFRPHSALPEDRVRRDDLDAVITSWLKSQQSASFLMRGEFIPLLDDAWCGTTAEALQVRWTASDGPARGV